MQRSLRAFGLAFLLSIALLSAPAMAGASPTASSPTAGAAVPSGAQVFSWTDNYSEGPIDHWYLEISSNPFVDYYPYGFFSGDIVYSSGDLKTTSVNLNAIGRALAPGTYYWHVAGYYGAWGSLGTFWTPVRSFTVQNSAAAAPAIAVSPPSLYFSAVQGSSAWTAQNLSVSNKGTGTLNFTMSKPVSVSWLALAASGTNTGQVFTIQVGANATGLSPGTYTSAVTVQDNGSSPAANPSLVTVPVTFEVFANEVTPPAGGSIAINAGAASTAQRLVTLNLAASDAGSGMGQMRFDNNDGLWSDWIAYSPTKPWMLLPGEGTKTVRAQFRDKLNNTTGIYSDTIVFQIPVQTSLSLPSVTPSNPKRGKTTTFRVSLTPGAAAAAGTTQLSLYHQETRWAKKRIRGKIRRYKQTYWKRRGGWTKAPGSAADITVTSKLKYAGKWRLDVSYSGSGYEGSATTKSFRVR